MLIPRRTAAGPSCQRIASRTRRDELVTPLARAPRGARPWVGTLTGITYSSRAECFADEPACEQAPRPDGIARSEGMTP